MAPPTASPPGWFVPLNPTVVFPLPIARRQIDATQLDTLKTRLELLPLIVKKSGPGPRMLTPLLIGNSPLRRTIGPIRPLEKRTVPPPPMAALSTTACRRDPAPLSSVDQT